MPTATEIKEARIRSNPMVNNLLINPGFETWKRGAGPYVRTAGNAMFGADEWWVHGGNATSFSVQRNASPKFGNYCAECTVTAPPGSYAYVQQGVEDYKSLEGQWVTYSVWVRASLENAVRLSFFDWNGSTSDGGFSDWHTGSGDWEQLVFTKKIRTGLSQHTTTAHNFGIYASVLGYGDVVYSVDGAVLVEGYYPEGVPFVPPNPATDLERCQRFYQGWDGTYGSVAMCREDVVISNTYWVDYWFPTPMYATPTLTLLQWGSSGFPAVSGTIQLGNKGFKEYRTALATTGGYFFSSWNAEIP